MNTFGKYLRGLRADKSLREMERLTGLSHTYLKNLEQGFDVRSGKEIKPTPDVLKKLSSTLDVPYLQLMCMVGYLDGTELASLIVENEHLRTLSKGGE